MNEEEKKLQEERPAEQTEEKAAEPSEASEKSAEKKDNAFKRLWKKTKQSVNDAVLENKIRSAYEKAHASFEIYEKDAILTKHASGEIADGVLTVFGKVEIKPWSVVIADDKEEKAYYVVSTSETTVKSTVEGVEYERPGTSIVLDPKVEEVCVVRAGKRYFIYKGADEKKD